MSQSAPHSMIVSGQKLLTSVMFVAVAKFRPPKHSDRKTNILALHRLLLPPPPPPPRLLSFKPHSFPLFDQFLVFTHVTHRLATVAIRHVGVKRKQTQLEETRECDSGDGSVRCRWMWKEKWKAKHPRIFSYTISC